MVKAEKQATQTQPLIHDPAEETSGAQANKLTISKVRAHQQEAYDAKDAPDAVERWRDIIDKTNDDFHKIKETALALVDAGTLNYVSTNIVQRAQGLKSGTGSFDIDDFVSQLLHFLSDAPAPGLLGEDDEEEEYQVDREDVALRWDKVGRKALAKSRRVPVMDFMLGPLEIEQKKRVVGKRTKFEKNKADEKKPQEITEADITRSENETTKNVAALERILQQREGKTNLFEFIINPRDFGQSVENMFYLSFLIREAKCAFEIDEVTKEPLIYLCEPPSDKDYRDGLKKCQLVMELDMATWKRAIEVFNIKEGIIPQRPKAETRIGNKWYG